MASYEDLSSYEDRGRIDTRIVTKEKLPSGGVSEVVIFRSKQVSCWYHPANPTMASLPPSQLFCYQNKTALDDLFLNACDSSGTVRKPRIPAELMYEPFQVFLTEVSTALESMDDPRFQMHQNAPRDPNAFFQDVIDLMKITATRYPSETALSEALSPKFQALLGVSVGRELTPRGPGEREGNTDGAYKATGFGRTAFIMIRADKLGSGSGGGGDSLVELLGHYSNLLLYQQPPSPSPTVLIEVVGPRLVISLAACDHISRPVVSPAVVSHSLLFQANPTVQISALAATLLALRRLVTTMTLHKDNLPRPLVTEDSRLGYNLVFRRYDGSYHKYLRATESYGTDAHGWCAAQGYAPSFSAVDVCPSWRRIEMTSTMNANNEQDWILAHGATDPAVRTAILVAVQQVLFELHNAGFVHGDVRAGNVLYHRAKEDGTGRMRVMLIDFDSAGRAGTARYSILPFATAYAPAAVPGGLVTAEHDNWRAETTDRFFS